jgi:replicative DNA helicase Mcm
MSQTLHTDDRIEFTDQFERFLKSYYRDELGQLLERYPDDQRSLEIDYEDLFRFDSSLADQYLAKPGELEDCAEEALRSLDLPVDIDLGSAHVRVTNLPDSETYNVGDYRTDQQGEYLSLSGQVARRTGVKPKPTEVAYECKRCGTITRIQIQDNDLPEPHECQGCERQGPFTINEERSEFVDFQVLRLQRPPEESTGGHSATIDVELEDDITGEVEPGDRLDAAGELKMRPTSDDDATFDYYLETKALRPKETSYEDIEIQPHLDDIKELAAENPFEQLVDAIAPKVYGYDHIKESIILQLFGGVRAEYPDGSADRGSIHVLLLGDPGVAKSKLLRAADQLAPRSTFASGKGTSAAGLTAGVVSDDFGGERYSLKAGALVTANDGVACIDELDKVDEETRSSLHTALEQQVVEVNKIMEASMPARTSLLAAGNPKYGRFDTHEAIAEQITIGPALLSRFDLMFMLQDEVEQEHDEEVADHIIDSNQEAIKATHGNEDSDSGLIDPDVDADLLRAYIAYARQRVHPTIEDKEVKRELRDNFVALRGMGEDADAPIPVTFRKLEAVLRLAQASARVRLSNTIESVDVQRAQDLIGQSLRDIEMDPDTGQFDADMVETGEPKSQRDRKKRVMSIIEDLAAENQRGADIGAVIERAGDMAIGPSTAEHDIDDLLNKGQVYSPQEGYLRPT